MDIYLSDEALFVINTLNSFGHKAYAVGGCIRDGIMGRKATDFDVTTDAETSELLNIFSQFNLITIGLKHGTICPIINGIPIEITTFRIDGKYNDLRHPENVMFSKNLNDDLCRRDFTLNALAFDGKDKITDLFGGVDDIKNKIIRAIGNADIRFNEDALRILRGIRFSSTLNFTIEKETAKSMIKNKNLLDNISNERISQEIKKILLGENLEYVLINFREIFQEVFPKTIIDEKTVNTVIRSPKDFETRLFLLIKNSPDYKYSLKNLRLSKLEEQSINELFSMKIIQEKEDVFFLLRNYHKENVKRFLDILQNKYWQKVYFDIIENGLCYNSKMLKISGRDLLSLGFSGEKIGKTLEILTDKVILGETDNEKEALIIEAKKQLG